MKFRWKVEAKFGKRIVYLTFQQKNICNLKFTFTKIDWQQNSKAYFTLDYKIWVKLHCRRHKIILLLVCWYVSLICLIFNLWQLIIFQKDKKKMFCWSLLNVVSSGGEVEFSDLIGCVEVSLERVTNTILTQKLFICEDSFYNEFYIAIFSALFLDESLHMSSINLMQAFSIDDKKHNLYSKTFYWYYLIFLES